MEKEKRKGSVNRKESFDRVEGDLGLWSRGAAGKKKKKKGEAVSHGNGFVVQRLHEVDTGTEVSSEESGSGLKCFSCGFE